MSATDEIQFKSTAMTLWEAVLFYKATSGDAVSMWEFTVARLANPADAERLKNVPVMEMTSLYQRLDAALQSGENLAQSVSAALNDFPSTED